jgi:cytochrome o ubiquinol oxidase subunit 1
MPLYALGFWGMPRRMERYSTPEWQPWLIAAALGAVFILFALVFLATQIAVSIRRRAELRDATGDPWDGHTLEWSTASPPPPWNFAVLPDVRARDAFLDMKRRGDTRRTGAFVDIAVPRNTAFGVLVGGFAFAFGFAMVWHIWWLAILGLALIAVATIHHGSDDDTEALVSAAEVARVDALRGSAP